MPEGRAAADRVVASWLGGSRLRGLLVAGLVVGLLAAAAALAVAHQAGTGPHRLVRDALVRIPTVPAPINALSPAQIRTAYDVVPLAAKGIDGSGQTIVVVDSFGSPTIAADLTHFDSYFGLPAPPSFRVLQPAGPVPAYSRHNSNRVGWAEETTLDVEWAHVMAPGASIVLVETPTSENEGTTGFPQIVAAERYVLRHKIGQVITQSFAATEQTFPSVSSILSFRSAYQLAARDHVTVLAATGDSGATSDEYNMKDLYTSRAVSWPATDPLVTAVGGTQLSLAANGTRLTPDVGWRDSGGGTSIAFPRPSYQDGVASVTGNARGVPDVAMDASCHSAVAVYGSFYAAGARWRSVCGTSLAAPLFAGIVALADQYAGHGQPHGLGLLNPAIYAIAASHEPGVVDIRDGTNSQSFVQGGQQYSVSGYTAGLGYDLVTGVGTIDAASFVPELAKLAG
ncbi:MAG: S53 family peptidase [Streptosporangiaceae bacterium]